jgi:hypothetical protein
MTFFARSMALLVRTKSSDGRGAYLPVTCRFPRRSQAVEKLLVGASDPQLEFKNACFGALKPDLKPLELVYAAQLPANQTSMLQPPCPNAKRIQTRISSVVVNTVKAVVYV